MKFLRIIIISFFILVVFIGAGLFIFIKTFDLNRYKQPIVAAVERSLGRTIDYGKSSLEWSFEKGVKMRIRDFVIKESQVFGTGNFLSSQALELGVSLKDLFLKRQITVLNIVIRSPKLTVIRLSDGRINAQSMPPASLVTSTAQQNKASQKSFTTTPALAALPAVVVTRIQVEDASVKFIDKMMNPPLTLELTKVGVLAENFTFGKTFPVVLSAAFLSDRENMSAKGQAKVDLSTQSFQLVNLVYNTDLISLPWGKLRQAIPGMQNMPPFEMPAGRVTVTIKRMEVGSEGIRSLSVDAELRDGQFRLVQSATGFPVHVSGIIIVVKDFSLIKPFNFRLSAAYLNKEPNIACKGIGQIFLNEQAFGITEGEAIIDGEKVSLVLLADMFPALKSVQQFKGKCTITLDRVRIGSTGLIALKGTAQLKQGSLQLKELGTPVDTLEASCTLSEASIQCSPFSFSVGKGSVQGTAVVDQYTSDQKYTVNGKVKELDLGQVLNQQDYPVKVAGIASGDLSVTGQGFDPQAALKNLSGNGSFDIKDGKLTDINILKIIFDRFTFIPNLSEIIEKSLPENIKSQLSRKDTPITAAKVVAVMNNGVVSLNPVSLEADSFAYKGQGTLILNQEYSIAGDFSIAKDLAMKIASPDSSQGFMLSPDQDIRFPVRVEGKGASFKIIPEVSSFSKQMLQQKAQQELNKVLDKAFDGKKNEGPSEAATGTSPAGVSSSTAAPSPDTGVVSDKDKKKQETKEAIKGLIDSFLK